MRYFTNKDGVKVEVSQEHLDTAVRVKRELQMASPSYKCSWKKHYELMCQEGFPEAENSERYRIMILDYQRKTGSLETVEEREDKVVNSKLESLKEVVGEIQFNKREVQLETQKLNKAKRELTLIGVIAEQVRDVMADVSEVSAWKYEPITYERESGKHMIVCLSDLHIGALVENVNNNSYNYEIASNRIRRYFNQVVQIGLENNVENIDVVLLGDAIEQIYMRKGTQTFDTEFPLAMQIVKAYELIRDFVMNLSSIFKVTYQGISGNHDRMEGNKNDNLEGDSAVYVINYMMKEFIRKEIKPRVKYIEVDDIGYSTVFEVNGVSIKCVHGDNERGNNKLLAHSSMDNRLYNILIMGHLHHYHVREVGQDKFEAYFGSLQGVNNYAKKGKFLSNASQGIILIDNTGKIDIRRIDVQ